MSHSIDRPVRGERVRALDLALPPGRMPMLRGTRLRKRWRYVGYYGPELMLCVADARIGPVPQRWWAVAKPNGELHGRTTVGRSGVTVERGAVDVEAGDVRIALKLDESQGIEIVSPTSAGHYIWTRKQADVRAVGVLELNGARHEIDGVAFIDESAGYHDRHSAWKWSAGNGLTSDGRAVSWNLVTGLHDAPQESERTLWIDREPAEVGPVAFAPDLSSITFAEGGALEFTEWAARAENANLLVMRSRYRQPFGTFNGTLPGGIELAQGYGVMEEHDVRW
jgi:Protein of unknown function (DUF2804)